jgi:hypothetical protein
MPRVLCIAKRMFSAHAEVLPAGPEYHLYNIIEEYDAQSGNRLCEVLVLTRWKGL